MKIFKVKISIILFVLITILAVGYFGFKQYQQQKIELQEVQGNLQKEKNNNPDISSIVAEWRPRIVYLECEFRYTNGTIYETGAGSGFAGGAVITTNKHILVNENGYMADVCYIKYPKDDIIYKVDRGDKMWVSNKYDVGHLIVAMNDTIRILNSSEYKTCFLTNVFGDDRALIGDEVIMLGYPTIGSQSDITATKGIISGYDGDYYITDAKIEHGNSGGLAILLKDNCYLGIPSYVIAGEVESLARILDSRAIFDTNFDSDK